MTLPESWGRALEQPVLSVKSPYTLRLNLARLLRTESRAHAAVISGLRADIPATAFLCGYQLAMRFIDPSLAPEQWAAFCVSEKGLTSLKAMQTELKAGHLVGVKSYAMLGGQGLDWLYVIARDAGDLVCRRVAATSTGVNFIPSSGGQGFIPELPHQAVRFTAATPDVAFLKADAHEQLNKPFRYHEDMLCLLTFAGWCLRMYLDQDRASALLTAMHNACDGYKSDATGYDAVGLQHFDDLLAALSGYAAGLPEEAKTYWQRDSKLLLMGQKARDVVRQRLSEA